ncbi:MAG: hypothetical protein R6T91_03125, partial [Bacteroidales bacterium]
QLQTTLVFPIIGAAANTVGFIIDIRAKGKRVGQKQKAMSLCGGIPALGGDLGVRAERVGDEALM